MGSDVAPVNNTNELFVDNSAFVLYPNPAGSIVNLKLNKSTMTDIDYKVFDISGKKIMEGKLDRNQTNTSIYVGDLNIGLYLIQLTTNQWQSTQKLMLNR